ncbi:MAG: class I SAM-dependent methyltransferase [Desulfurococcaceae archaeon]
MDLRSYEFSFSPVHGYWFTSFLVEELRRRGGCFQVTLDLGLTVERVCVESGRVEIRGEYYALSDLAPSEVNRVRIVTTSGEVYDVVKSTEQGYYKLKATGADKAPTLEINGIHMHRITGIDPWRDTLLKVRATGVSRGHVVLDTCMGLGYTAIASLRRGASLVYTFEIDENVVWIAQRNPWSRALESGIIRKFLGDVTDLVTELPDEFFDRAIHDPPRFSKSTGDLYSLEFYRELYRVLKKRGVLFHYTGEPRRHGSPSILKGIKRRLEEAGFRVLRFDESAQGFTAVKL